MTRPFRSYDRLALFRAVARESSFSVAAEVLHMTKGAVSYQMRALERELGFALFDRHAHGAEVSVDGRRLLGASEIGFGIVDAELERLRRDSRPTITIGLTTYFASRWLSRRLTRFTDAHPGIGLRLQSTTMTIDPVRDGIDVLIRWGDGRWTDRDYECLFECPAFPVAHATLVNRVDRQGLADVLRTTRLLHDEHGSEAWKHWYRAAGLAYGVEHDDDGLVIPDPNVRLQAVADGQGVALADVLAEPELEDGRIGRFSNVALLDRGYFLACPASAPPTAELTAFRDWLLQEGAAFARTTSEKEC